MRICWGNTTASPTILLGDVALRGIDHHAVRVLRDGVHRQQGKGIVIVECGERSRFIGYDDIYVQEADIYSYSYNTSFDGEGAME